MRYDKTLKIKMSDKLKTTIKYYDKNYEKTIRKIIIAYFERLSEIMPEISDFYETVKPRMPEYFEYAKSIGFDDSDFEKKKHKEKKINSLKFINKLYKELQWKEKVETDLNDIIKELKTKLKQNENNTR